MNSRYQTPAITRFCTSEEAVLYSWLRAETAIARAQAERAIVPVELPHRLADLVNIRPADVHARERTTKHDVAAFVDILREKVGGELGSYVHFGLTSSDVVDTGQALRIVAARNTISETTSQLIQVLHAMPTRMPQFRLGRTHGQWADVVPGMSIVDRSKRDLRETLRHLTSVPIYGKFSGPVGQYTTAVPPHVEARALDSLALRHDKFPTQITSRLVLQRFAYFLVEILTTLESLAMDLRLLALEEVGEVREGFGPGQVGSSAMPHKRNPINLEKLCGLARIGRGYLSPIMETTGNLWLERDISNSSVERVAFWDLVQITHYAVTLAKGTIESLVWSETAEQRVENFSSSAEALVEAVKSGEDRTAAYFRIQSERHQEN